MDFEGKENPGFGLSRWPEIPKARISKSVIPKTGIPKASGFRAP